MATEFRLDNQHIRFLRAHEKHRHWLGSRNYICEKWIPPRLPRTRTGVFALKSKISFFNYSPLITDRYNKWRRRRGFFFVLGKSHAQWSLYFHLSLFSWNLLEIIAHIRKTLVDRCGIDTYTEILFNGWITSASFCGFLFQEFLASSAGDYPVQINSSVLIVMILHWPWSKIGWGVVFINEILWA